MPKKNVPFAPSPEILSRYAHVLVNFALNSGTGIKKNEVAYIVTQTPGIPLARQIYTAVLAAGAHPILQIMDDSFKLLHVQHASDAQLTFFPKKYYRGLADTIDHWVRVLADDDPRYLKDADPRKVILSQRSVKPFRDWLDVKEDKGKFTWTLALYGTEGLAKEAGLTPAAYWEQIRRACFLDEKNPVAKWRSVFADMDRILTKLNRMPIDKLHVKAKGTDLWITLGEKRRWLGGSGRNIPSFEIFTSPDWRGTDGEMFFDLPLYRFGNIIKDIRLVFKNGRVVNATARKNERLLHEMIKQKNADKIGEYSLTDRRFSHITKFMADTLYDENHGGTFGNTHLALGKSYHDTYAGKASSISAAQFKKLGFNDSVEHTDIVATSDREVTAVMKDGTRRVIYRHGEFTI